MPPPALHFALIKKKVFISLYPMYSIFDVKSVFIFILQHSLSLPTLLVETLGPELRRFATLNDLAYNEIEVLIE
jgi:hypothetical protein